MSALSTVHRRLVWPVWKTVSCQQCGESRLINFLASLDIDLPRVALDLIPQRVHRSSSWLLISLLVTYHLNHSEIAWLQKMPRCLRVTLMNLRHRHLNHNFLDSAMILSRVTRVTMFEYYRSRPHRLRGAVNRGLENTDNREHPLSSSLTESLLSLDQTIP